MERKSAKSVFLLSRSLLLNHFEPQSSKQNSYYPWCWSTLLRMLLLFCWTTFVETAVCLTGGVRVAVPVSQFSSSYMSEQPDNADFSRGGRSLQCSSYPLRRSCVTILLFWHKSIRPSCPWVKISLSLLSKMPTSVANVYRVQIACQILSTVSYQPCSNKIKILLIKPL